MSALGETSQRSLLQQGVQSLEDGDEACNAPARLRCGASFAQFGAAGVAAGALLLCCSYATPRVAGSFSGVPPRPDVGDLDGIAELQMEIVELERESEFAEPVRMALAGEPKPPPGEWQRYVVFRCRDADYAGGFGDRLAGLFGAAYLAMSMGRQLKVDWPELEKAFVQSTVDWHYDPEELAITAEDQQILDTHEFGGVSNFPDDNFGGLTADVIVFNAWDVDAHYSDHWRKFPSDVSTKADEYRVIVMSGNRAGTRDWFATLQNDLNVVPAGCSFWELYHVIFGVLLKPNPIFMQKPIPLQVGSSTRPVYRIDVPMEEAVRVLNSPDTFSIGVHIRAGDETSKQEADMDRDSTDICAGVDPIEVSKERVGCIVDLAQNHAKASSPQKVLVVFSDSRCVKRHIIDYFAEQADPTFDEVWSQSITGTINIDTVLQSESGGDESHAWDQSMRDWMLMRHMDMFAMASSYTFVSGFPAGALATTSVNKELYVLPACTRLDKTAICADRFC